MRIVSVVSKVLLPIRSAIRSFLKSIVRDILLEDRRFLKELVLDMLQKDITPPDPQLRADCDALLDWAGRDCRGLAEVKEPLARLQDTYPLLVNDAKWLNKRASRQGGAKDARLGMLEAFKDRVSYLRARSVNFSIR